MPPASLDNCDVRAALEAGWKTVPQDNKRRYPAYSGQASSPDYVQQRQNVLKAAKAAQKAEKAYWDNLHYWDVEGNYPELRERLKQEAQYTREKYNQAWRNYEHYISRKRLGEDGSRKQIGEGGTGDDVAVVCVYKKPRGWLQE